MIASWFGFADQSERFPETLPIVLKRGADAPRPEPAGPGRAATMAAQVASGKVAKIGSIGLRINRGISSHGVSLNVSCDLEPFAGITSCGIEHCQVSSVEAETDSAPSVNEIGLNVGTALAGLLGRDIETVEPSTIGLESTARATAYSTRRR